VWFRGSVEACSPSFSLIRLRRVARVALGGWSLAYGDRDLCVSRVVDCSSLVMHGKIPLYWEI